MPTSGSWIRGEFSESGPPTLARLSRRFRIELGLPTNDLRLRLLFLFPALVFRAALFVRHLRRYTD